MPGLENFIRRDQVGRSVNGCFLQMPAETNKSIIENNFKGSDEDLLKLIHEMVKENEKNGTPSPAFPIQNQPVPECSARRGSHDMSYSYTRHASNLTPSEPLPFPLPPKKYSESKSLEKKCQ